MIKNMGVQRFKNIWDIDVHLEGVDILIGGNNAGKSSTLQAVQFGVSIMQTTNLERPLDFKNSNTISRTLSPEQIIYSPIKDIYLLIHGDEPLREGVGRDIRLTICEIDENGQENSATIAIKKGRNKNISIELTGAVLCQKMADMEHTYSMYVPGLAGIPFSEEFRSLGAIRRAVAKGDSNTILRNVLYHLSIDNDKNKWDNFEHDLNAIFPDIRIRIDARLNNDGIIDVFVKDGHYEKPIDAMGTGVLQAIQISAYMNYFEPQLLLLDEPDSHLHPNNQKTLAQMILQVAKKNKNILLATHSRHLVGALRKDAQVILMKNGLIVESDYNEYDLLMEIGALDEYDVFRDPNIKYIVATEDAKPESNKLLSLLLQASGFQENSFFILPYEGSSKIESVIYLARCLNRFRSDLSIIVHRDLDGMYPDEIADYVGKIEREENVHCFVTDYNDLEIYFCNPDHILTVLSDNNFKSDKELVISLYASALADVEEKSLKKFLNRKLDPMRDQNRGEHSLAAQAYFKDNKLKCINGHFLIGSITSLLHKEYHIGKEVLLQKSDFLCVPKLKEIADAADLLQLSIQ